MRDWSIGARLAIIVFVSYIATAAHAADDMLVMPYRCAVVDGKPMLTPSDEEHGHRIYGTRERKKIETCSTVDSKRCRQWTAFKFDMDCGGARVSWMQVFANASEHTRRRVWEHNGRLRVRDTPMRNARIDDICAFRMGPQMDWSNKSQLCEESSPLTAPTATNMPAGFAPIVGLDAAILSGEAFERLSARYARAGAEAPTAKAAITPKSPSAPPAKTATARIDPPASAPPASPPERVQTAEAPVETAAEQAAQEPRATAKPDLATVVPRDAVPNVTVEAARREPPAAVHDVAAPQTEPAPAAFEPPPEPEAPARVANAETPAPERAAPPPVASEAAPSPTATASVSTVTPNAIEPADHDVAYLIVALASGLLMITLLGVHWLGTAKPIDGPASPASSPLADTVSAERPHVEEPVIAAVAPQPTAPSPDNALIVVTSRTRGASDRSAQTGLMPTPRRLSIGERMPNTKHEALELLGMGVATDGNLTSLKKIIDGLRMNWHPDLAADDMDRRTRELRLKQINAAWEILGGKNAGAPG